MAPGVFLAEVPKGGPSGDRQAPASPEPRIVGGNTTTIAEWPWQVAITADSEFFSGDGFDRQFCGGSLVAPTIVVSAAHCFFDVLEGGHDFDPPDLFAAITGRTQLSSSTGQEIEVGNLYFFVDGSGKRLYNPNTNDWDAVFVELASPSPSANSTPIQIAGADEAASWAPGNENAWATGWGTISSGGASSDTLREVNIDRIADSTCGSPSSYGGDFHPETMVCAGEMAGGQDTCQGDSGGPLVTPIGGGVFRLIGDTSWGFGCALPNLPGIYGRVAEHPMCSALQEGIQDVAAVNVVGSGGCLGAPSQPPPPAAPTITDTDPNSPANDNDPEVKGTVGGGSPTTVKLYTNATCSGAPDATGTVAAFTGAGITVNVPGDATTMFSGRATNAAANDSACSNSFAYTEDSTPPAPPTITDTDPNSPADDNNPEVKGNSSAGSTVKLYQSNDCTGAIEAQGSAAAFNNPGLTATVADNQTHQFTATATDQAGNTSSCSSSFAYTEDSTPPAAPTITDTDPDSPANDNDPEVKGTVGGGSPTTVKLYTNATCSGAPNATGTVAAFTGAGITVNVPGDATTTFSARATDAAANDSTCSDTFAYTEDSTLPEPPPPEPPPSDGEPGPGAPSTPLTLDLDAPKQALKKKVKLIATASVASTLAVVGKAIKDTATQLAANQRTAVKAKLKRGAAKELAKQLEKMGKAKVKIRGTATSQSGAEATDTGRVKLKD